MKITSPAFENDTSIPAKYTCEGLGINPPLAFSDIPVDTKSLVLIMDDPDAPAGLWVHWLIWNMTPDIHQIKENSIPANAVVGANTKGINQYGGPCPPDREHRYFFKLFALDITLGISPQSDKNLLEKAMANHIINQAELIGLYKKENQ